MNAEYDIVPSGGLVDTQTSTIIQVSLPTALAKDVERIAKERKISVDILMADMLTQLVRFEEEYAAAKADHLAILAKDYSLGSHGKLLGPRDELHERK